MHSSWGRTELHIEGAEEGEGAGKVPVPREGSLALLLFISKTSSKFPSPTAH